MFPVTIELAPADTVLLEDLMNDLQQLGYMIEPFGKNTFVVQGTPADVTQGNEKQVSILCWNNLNISVTILNFPKEKN
jgi:DNA mismatch repair protein MutL